MIDRERLKIRIDCDKMEKIIKNHMQVQYHKICFLEKDKTFSSNRRTIHCFLDE